jgi:lysophospholipase L1-like esterase
MPSASLPKPTRRLAALLVGLLAAPLFAEGLYRLLLADHLGPTTHPAYVIHDSDLGWAYRPGASARHRTEEFDVGIRIHERGFRGAPWQLDLQVGRRRLLLLGDSYAFGWGVEEEHSAGSLLASSAPGWTVFNAGVSGYGTGQQRLLLERLLGELRPDAVVVLFCENDLFENGSERSYGKRKPWFALDSGELVLGGWPVREPWLERHSLLWRALVKGAWSHAFARRVRDPAGEWDLAHALLLSMRDRLQARGGGVPLLVASESGQLADWAGRQPGIEAVDLRPALATAGELARFPRDGHWTAEGHARVAEALALALARLFGPS